MPTKYIIVEYPVFGGVRCSVHNVFDTKEKAEQEFIKLINKTFELKNKITNYQDALWFEETHSDELNFVYAICDVDI